MTDPTLIEMPVPKKHRTTRQTSRASYAIGREQFTGRKADVLRWLSAHWNHYQESPTSAELARDWKVTIWSFDKMLLYVRRGLSDLQTEGVVEVAMCNRGGKVVPFKRVCAVTGNMCMTWRVSQR